MIRRTDVFSQCCNASVEERDGGFWYSCSECDREVNPDAPALCPGSFTLNYKIFNQYAGICNECGGKFRTGVGYIQYGKLSGALQPHRQ